MVKHVFKHTLSVAALMMTSVFAGNANAQSWSGPHIGASVGAGRVSSDATTTTVFSPTGYFATSSIPAINSSGVQSFDATTGVFGVDMGLDHQMGNLLIGVDVDFSGFSANADATTTTTYPCCGPTNFTITQAVQTKWIATAQARLGMIFPSSSGHDLLIYVSGGYAASKVRVTSHFTDTFATANEFGEKDVNAPGWVAGVGAELMMWPGWALRPDYQHVDLGGVSPLQTAPLTAFAGPISFPTNNFTHHQELTEDFVRIGVVHHF